MHLRSGFPSSMATRPALPERCKARESFNALLREPKATCAGSVRCLALLLLFCTIAKPLDADDLTTCRTLLRTGEYEKCIELASSHAKPGDPNCVLFAELAADACVATGKYQQALATLQPCVPGEPFDLALSWKILQVLPYAEKSELVPALQNSMQNTITRGLGSRTPNRFTLVALAEFLLHTGSDPKLVQDIVLAEARNVAHSDPAPLLISGRLALTKHDYALAADNFQVALALAPDMPDAFYGLARSLEDSAPVEAAAMLQKGLKINPRHTPSLLLQAEQFINKEQYEQAQVLLKKITSYHPTQPEALAMGAAIQFLQGHPEEAESLRMKALSTWSKNPHVDHLIGEILSRKYRFEGGVSAQRRSLQLDPDYLPAQKQLALDLLRLGHEIEGWDLLDQVYQKDQYDVATYNLITLRDELNNFTTLAQDGLHLRMEKTEAAIYGSRALELLLEAKSTLCQKYDLQLPRTVLVEIFPKPADFAVRTFGLPGAGGFLGVCFGDVITARSPASQTTRPNNWESVLWHEFAHVVTLNKTHNRMPRWLSEGISVYEERQRDARWGERMTPAYRTMITNGELTPISQLSGAFLSPKSSQHLMFAYYESSLVVEYIEANFGHAALLEILNDLATGIPINDAIERHTVALPQLENDFRTFAERKARLFGWYVDWKSADFFPMMNSPDPAGRISKWMHDNPRNYSGLKECGEIFSRLGQISAAADAFQKAAWVFPRETGPQSALARLADMQRQQGDAAGEQDSLRKLAEFDDDAAAALIRLLEISQAAQDWDQLQLDAERLRAIKPLIPQPYTGLSLAAEHRHAPRIAIPALQTLLQMSPVDPADLHFRLALQYQQIMDLPQAKRHVLQALEQAPRYLQALDLLLKLQEVEVPQPESK